MRCREGGCPFDTLERPSAANTGGRPFVQSRWRVRSVDLQLEKAIPSRLAFSSLKSTDIFLLSQDKACPSADREFPLVVV